MMNETMKIGQQEAGKEYETARGLERGEI